MHCVLRPVMTTRETVGFWCQHLFCLKLLFSTFFCLNPSSWLANRQIYTSTLSSLKDASMTSVKIPDSLCERSSTVAESETGFKDWSINNVRAPWPPPPPGVWKALFFNPQQDFCNKSRQKLFCVFLSIALVASCDLLYSSLNDATVSLNGWNYKTAVLQVKTVERTLQEEMENIKNPN